MYIPDMPKSKSFAACLAAALFCASPSVGFDLKYHLDKFDFLTEYYFSQDMHAYFGHKNETLRDAYLISGESALEASFVSYDSILHLGAMYSNYIGMGRQNAAILFDPQRVNYALVPFFEFRHGGIFYNAGLDHRCFHLVDRAKGNTIPPYWNQIYVKASSANYRFQQMRKGYLLNGRYGYLERLRWSAWAGYFFWKWGDADPTLISGGHEWSTTAGVDVAYSLYKTKSWLFSGRNKLVVYGDTTGTGYWAGEAGLDADIYSRKHALGFFIDYSYEFPRDLPPRFSKDRLFSWGFRFRY